MALELAQVEQLGSRKKANIDRTISIELARVTEAAARAAARHMGTGDKEAVDGAAVEAMRTALNALPIDGTVVIGEGEKDEAPMLYIGEKVGTGDGEELEIAVDPVDGTTLTSKGRENALSVIAIAQKGNFLNVPFLHYMDKLAVGTDVDINKLSLDMPADEVVKEVARQKSVKPENIVVCLLDRPRNQHLMDGVRKAGGRMKLITDGDVAGAVSTAMRESGVDILMGSGGAPEGVVAAAALKCLGGNILCRAKFENDAMRQHMLDAGFDDPDKTFTTEELAKGEVIFAATGVTDGSWLKGVHRTPLGEMTHTVVMRSLTGTIRYIESTHRV